MGNPSHRVPDFATDGATTNHGHGCATPSRSVQLCGWLRKLDGRLVRGQEGMVLRPSWEGLPPGRWLRDYFGTLRLQRWLRQLAGRLVGCEESLVLPAREQGLPASGGGLRVGESLRRSGALAAWPSSGALECFC